MEDVLARVIEQAHALVDFDDEDPFGGYAYLRSRGVTDEQIRTFKLGIGPDAVEVPPPVTPIAKHWFAQFQGTMKGQIVLPLYNSSGVLRGLETRLWEERKYSQFLLPTWKEDAMFFGLPAAMESIWETEVVFLVEGVFDFFPVQRVFPNTLCPLTAKVTPAQFRFLRRYARHVVFMFDRDKKGMEVSTKAVERYNVLDQDPGFLVHHMSYPAKDPGALYEMWGATRFGEYLRRQADSMNLYL